MTWKRGAVRGDSLCGLQVLVVEDEPLIALELESLLQDEGAAVIGPGRNVNEAVELLKDAPISVALLDVRLGRDSIAPLASLLSDRGVPFAFYTGQTEADAVRCAWPLAPVLQKPATPRQLVAAIRKLGAAREGRPPS
jgi:DNA-binding response OmpR family regulator